MKKILALVMVAVLLLSMATFVSANKNYMYKAPYGTPDIDGEIDEVWDRAMWTKVEDPWQGELRTDARMRVKALWDEAHLYFLAEIYDTSRNYQYDNFEIYLDQNGDKTGNYGLDDTHTIFFLYTATVKPEGWFYQPGARAAVQELDGDIYILEGYINWPNGSDSVWVGDEMGFELMYNDATDYVNFLDALRWSAETYPHGPGGTIPADPQPSLNASAWGYLTLVEEDEGIWDGANMHTDAEYPMDDEDEDPVEEPTEAPTEEPTEAPTEEPTEAPTEEPTEAPTEEPTEAPTEEPTEEPTEAPTEEPTEAPTEEPTEAPTEEPTEAPTEEATEDTTGDDTAPETFDFGVAAAIAAIVSLAGYVISKKR